MINDNKQVNRFLGRVDEPVTHQQGVAWVREKLAEGVMVRYGRQRLGLKRIRLRANPANARAIHVCEKCGFRKSDRSAEDVYMEIK